MNITTRRRLLTSAVFVLALPISMEFWQVKAAEDGVITQSPPVAILNGHPIYESDLENFAAAQLQALHNQAYQVKKEALDTLITRKLLEAEAASKGLSADTLLEREVDGKFRDPSEEEMKAYYLGQQDRRPFPEIEVQLRVAYRQARIQQGRQDYIKALRSTASVAILLGPPRVAVTRDTERLKGNPNGPVVIVEFSDYQCPYCQAAEATLKDVLARYEGRVSLAYRDFPLSTIHPQAQIAAEASRCAAAQGKFWQYHDALFANQSALQRSDLMESARRLELDERRFEACLTSGEYRGAVQSDYDEGIRAGVTGTPAFFVNGIYLKGNQPVADFTKIIDDELVTVANQRTQTAELPGKEAPGRRTR